MKVCTRMCGDCPFSTNSIPGFLADYTIEDFSHYYQGEVLFPCHKLVKRDMNVNDISELVRSEQLHLCRGYVEMFAKSCKLPREPKFANIVKIVKKDLSEKSMSFHQFVQHHSRFLKQNDET